MFHTPTVWWLGFTLFLVWGSPFAGYGLAVFRPPYISDTLPASVPALAPHIKPPANPVGPFAP
jgi:hypothetical protein